mmetsp:Transcript_10136/g.33114  ORF Transcript_10136/g.33114 Transcript_10136/m.33114 type:complete len:241 (-) Transcript_10136:288-1010(-)
MPSGAAWSAPGRSLTCFGRSRSAFWWAARSLRISTWRGVSDSSTNSRPDVSRSLPAPPLAASADPASAPNRGASRSNQSKVVPSAASQLASLSPSQSSGALQWSKDATKCVVSDRSAASARCASGDRSRLPSALWTTKIVRSPRLFSALTRRLATPSAVDRSASQPAGGRRASSAVAARSSSSRNSTSASKPSIMTTSPQGARASSANFSRSRYLEPMPETHRLQPAKSRARQSPKRFRA